MRQASIGSSRNKPHFGASSPDTIGIRGERVHWGAWPDKNFRPRKFSAPRRSSKKLRATMTFQLHQAQYDNHTKRAYVEFRQADGDGGDQLVVAVLTFRTSERLWKQTD